MKPLDVNFQIFLILHLLSTFFRGWMLFLVLLQPILASGCKVTQVASLERELVEQGYGNMGDKAESATGWRALIFAAERGTRAVEEEATID